VFSQVQETLQALWCKRKAYYKPLFFRSEKMANDLSKIESILDANQPKLILWYTNYTKLVFEEGLKAAFGHWATPKRFRYNPDPKLTGISIYRKGPKRIENFPQIAITAAGGQNSIEYLGQEIVKEHYDNTGEFSGLTFSGNVYPEIELELATLKSPKDLNQLHDLVSIYLRFLFREKFNKMNVAYQGQKSSKESQEENERGIVYLQTITVPCQTAFEQTLPKDLFETINAITVDVGAIEN
jgi:hypothetical protein